MDPKEQVEAARGAVLAVAHPDTATLVVTGADRTSWLNGLLTCDLARRPPGTAAYGLAVARSGRVLADAIVVSDDAAGRVVLAVPRSVVAPLREHLEHYLVMEDAEIAPDADGHEVWALHGPRSAEVLDAARGAAGDGSARAGAGASGAPVEVLSAAVDRTGYGGGIVLAPRAASAAVRGAIARAVAQAGGVVGDRSGWDALRLERAVPQFGEDFDERTYPQEAALEKTAVSFDKGCYLGQEVVCMLEMRGHVKRKLVALVLDAIEAPPRQAPVSDEGGAAVGEVTSAVLSPTLGKAVGLAMVKRAYAEVGKRLVVAGASAKVVDRPA